MFGLPAALLVFGAALLDHRRGWGLPHALVAIGDASYTYYLSHLPVLYLTFALLAPIQQIPTFLLVMLAFAATLVTALLMYRYTEKPLLILVYSLSRAAAKPPRS